MSTESTVNEAQENITEEMSNQSIKTPEELGEMLDNGFLRMAQKFAKDAVKEGKFSSEAKGFIVKLEMGFPLSDADLNYVDVARDLNISIAEFIPINKENVENVESN